MAIVVVSFKANRVNSWWVRAFTDPYAPVDGAVTRCSWSTPTTIVTSAGRHQVSCFRPQLASDPRRRQLGRDHGRPGRWRCPLHYGFELDHERQSVHAPRKKLICFTSSPLRDSG